jgi:hypothetical protein
MASRTSLNCQRNHQTKGKCLAPLGRRLFALGQALGRELLLRLWLRYAAALAPWHRLRRKLGFKPIVAVPALLRSAPTRGDGGSPASSRSPSPAAEASPERNSGVDYDSDSSYRRFLEEYLAEDSAGGGEEPGAGYRSDGSQDDRFLEESNRAAGLDGEVDLDELFPPLPGPHHAPHQPEAFGGGPAIPTPEAAAPPLTEAEARTLLEEVEAALEAEGRLREILATVGSPPRNPLHRGW